MVIIINITTMVIIIDIIMVFNNINIIIDKHKNFIKFIFKDFLYFDIVLKVSYLLLQNFLLVFEVIFYFNVTIYFTI